MNLRRILEGKWVRWGGIVVLAGLCVGIGMWISRCDRDELPDIKPRPLTPAETPSYAKYLKGVRIYFFTLEIDYVRVGDEFSKLFFNIAVLIVYVTYLLGLAD